MDDFRVGSLSPADPYRDQDGQDSLNRKKRPRPKLHDADQDEVVLSSEQEETGGESFDDFYAPAEPPEEP